MLFSGIYVIFGAPMLDLESRIMESRNSRKPSPIAESNIAINLMIWLGFYVKAFFKRISFCIIFGIHSPYLALNPSSTKACFWLSTFGFCDFACLQSSRFYKLEVLKICLAMS